MRIYISGPIGSTTDFPERFAAGCLEVARFGYEPVSPLNNGLARDAGWLAHMKADIRTLLECEGIYLLRDWHQSRGARIGQMIAQGLDMLVLYQEEKVNAKM